jgi:cytochrome c556
MQRYLSVALIAVLVFMLGGCAQQTPPPPPQSPYKMTATVKDIMDSLVDPGADYIWEAVETIVSVKGVEEKMPRTDEEWKAVRRHAIMLAEATNLLQMPGRQVAKAGEKADDPNVELAPEQIQQMIDSDRATWNKYAQGLHDATMEAFQAIDAKDAQALLNNSDKIDTACENCHKYYWYPDEKPHAAEPQKSSD